MVEGIELSEDNETFSKILVHDIIERAFKTILDQSESCCISYECVQHCSSKMTCTSTKDISTASQMVPIGLKESCYSSISKHPEVCIPKQGEGDVQQERIMDNLASSTNSTSTCSINSDDELLQILQKDSHELSFDNIHFSDSEVDDAFIEGKPFEASTYNHPIEDVENDNFVEQINTGEEQEIYNNTFLQQSPKFYHPINAQCSLEHSWRMNENKVPQKEIITTSQSPELLDDQLDGDMEQIEAYISKNPSNTLNPRNYDVSKTAVFNEKAELALQFNEAPSNDDIQWDWEEAVEEQVEVTEPDIENQETFQIKNHSDPVSGGKEWDPSMEQMQKTYSDNNSSLLTQASLPVEFPNHNKTSDTEEPVNYLSLPNTDKNMKRNNKFFVRLASAVFSRFRRAHIQRKTKITV